MIPYDVDPSLHSSQPQPSLLEDGFSAPRSDGDALRAGGDAPAPSLKDALAAKSEF